ncbi:UvrD-helicase domain-containing protein [Azohydromonas lata]|uniref:UvrD-helicase domain-containing protein n=1 Tax=Azohydromonas lata TaxID=45677 RepID=UPI001470F7A7|nr:UvrD-helicase domain-containing protein [Azohydromonas lata]
MWSRAIIRNGTHHIELRGLPHDKAPELASKLKAAAEAENVRLAKEAETQRLRLQAERHARRIKLQSDMTACCKDLLSAEKECRDALAADYYLAASDRARLVQQINARSSQLKEGQALLANPEIDDLEATEPLRKLVQYLTTFLKHHESLLKERNDSFVSKEYARWKIFFDHCETRPLTEEQARAAIVFEENTQLVAAAGSGKTSTIVGKVLYILAKGLASADEILCLAFNKKAAQEIGIRIKQRLKAMSTTDANIKKEIKDLFLHLSEKPNPVESKTFHSLGKSLIDATGQGQKKRVSSQKETEARLTLAIKQCHEQIPGFTAKWLLLQTVNRYPRPTESRFTNEQEYNEYLRGLWQQRRKLRNRKDEKEGILTLGCDSLVRSFEEAAISNWLYVMGVNFQYEESFEIGAKLLCPGKRWLPDFSYEAKTPTGGIRIVHEHFALNEKGRAPSFFSDPAVYEKQATEKQKVLRHLDTRHFWTTSADYISGILFEKLESNLRTAGVEFAPRNKEQVLARLKEIGLEEDTGLIARAASQIRQNNWTLEHLYSLVPSQPEPVRAKLFIEVAWHVTKTVERLLQDSGAMDFDEMIKGALRHLEQPDASRQFRVVLVDEFQDTAPGRGELVRRLLSSHENGRLFAVGDDWQAINRFAGSDLMLFKHFGKHFNRRLAADATLHLTQTFRSNQGIADAGRKFVMKNKSQLPKEVHAADKSRNGVIDVLFQQENTKTLDVIDSILQKWVDHYPTDSKPSVFLLGRYGQTRSAGLSKDDIKSLQERWAERIEFAFDKQNGKPAPYLTMHQSKGLEADYVIILGMHSVSHDYLCFPSVREDDPLLSMVLPPKEAVADADERRLFYVALTRAKRQAVLLAPSSHPSPYIIELLLDHRDGLVTFNGTADLPPICGTCRKGLGFKRYNPKNKSHFFACSDRWKCGATWKQ